MLLRRSKHAFGLYYAEDLGLAENITEFGKLLPGNTRKHFAYDQIDVIIWTRLKLIGYLMRAEKCWYAAEQCCI